VTVRPRVLTYGVSIEEDWVATSDRDGTPLPNEEKTWSPEHLVLTGLVRCVLTSFRYHARRAGHEPAATYGSVSGTVTFRAEDERFALVEARVELDVTFDPLPSPDDVRLLVFKGERDCFVGASLTVTPDYHWTVNGEDLS
jgi:organic hydroperoxide reductase OsmC/OhrA